MSCLQNLQSDSGLCRYDASAHMTEETHRADIQAPLGMLTAVLLAGVVGWCADTTALACKDCLAVVDDGIWNSHIASVGRQTVFLLCPRRAGPTA